METQEVTVYKANYRLKDGFFKTWWIMFGNIVKSKELIYQLFRRDFLNQYKKSFLGIGWIFIAPIIGIASWVVLNSTGVLSPGDVGVPYPVYVLLGSTIWGLFMGIYSGSAGTLTAGSGFIDQVKFPHEALLAKQIMQQLAAFVIVLSINLIIFMLYGVTPSLATLLLPLAILPLIFLSSAIGLVISVVSVVASDISQIVGIILGFVFYITPIVYAIDKFSDNDIVRRVVELNPLTYLIGGVRELILYGRILEFEKFLICSVVAFFMFLLALRLFYVSEDKVIEKMV